jgi:hypothetical protein
LLFIAAKNLRRVSLFTNLCMLDIKMGDYIYIHIYTYIYVYIHQSAWWVPGPMDKECLCLREIYPT